jgi:hypothetical protein
MFESAANVIQNNCDLSRLRPEDAADLLEVEGL